jgi:mRNA interferase RelE/StbE
VPPRSYTIAVHKDVQKEVRRQPSKLQDRVLAAIEDLALTPRPPGATRLTGQPDMYRIRFGSFRLIYQIDDEATTVLVRFFGSRGDIYKRLPR